MVQNDPSHRRSIPRLTGTGQPPFQSCYFRLWVVQGYSCLAGWDDWPCTCRIATTQINSVVWVRWVLRVGDRHSGDDVHRNEPQCKGGPPNHDDSGVAGDGDRVSVPPSLRVFPRETLEYRIPHTHCRPTQQHRTEDNFQYQVYESLQWDQESMHDETPSLCSSFPNLGDGIALASTLLGRWSRIAHYTSRFCGEYPCIADKAGLHVRWLLSRTHLH